MKLDLDELERKATAAPFGSPPELLDDGALTMQAAGYHDSNAIESVVCELRHRRSKQEVIDAVPALIARIRELEAALGHVIDRTTFEQHREHGISGAEVVLAKGAVLT